MDLTIPTLTADQLALLAQFWTYQAEITDADGNLVPNPETQEAFVTAKIIDQINNVLIEQNNRNLLSGNTTVLTLIPGGN